MSPASVGRSLCVVVALGLVSACGVQPTSASGSQVSAAPADHKQLLTYGQGLQFWSRLGAADRQLIDQKVFVTIEPEVGSYKLTQQELASGRIVAQFRKAPGGEVRRFGLLDADTLSYWGVSQQDGRYYGRFTSESFDTSYAIEIDWHDSTSKAGPSGEPNLPWGQSIGQWRFDPITGGGTPYSLLEDTGGSGWATCTPWGCCRTH